MPGKLLEDADVESSEDKSEDRSYDSDSEEDVKPSGRRIRKRTMCLCSCCVVFVVLFLAIQYVSYTMMAKEFVRVRSDWAPYLNTTPVTALQMFEREHAEDWVCDRIFYTFGDTARHAASWFNKTGWLDVSFPSRHHDGIPDINVTAFYFKSFQPNQPTIIVQHGNNVNNRDHTVITAAYFLNSMGYNVLLPNLRNHGDSGTTPRELITWSQQEAYDTLGAWDYVVNDPDGKLGGPQTPNRTALYGFSMGGLICRVAFALEPRIPALLTDGAVWNAKEVLEYHINYVVPGLGWFFIPSAWFWAKRITGYDLDRLIPEKLLKARGDRRMISAVQTTDDDTVPFQQSQAFHEFVVHSDYRVPVEWYQQVDAAPGDGTATQCGTHCSMHLRWPWKYRHFLCEFFGFVFNEPERECDDPRLRHPAAAGVGQSYP